MKHRLITVASALSLLLSAATVAAWVRSYFHAQQVSLNRDSGFIHGVIRRGSLVIADLGAHSTALLNGITYVEQSDAKITDRSRGSSSSSSLFGFAFYTYDPPKVPNHQSILVIPCWSLLCVFVLLPAGRSIAALRARHGERNGVLPARSRRQPRIAGKLRSGLVGSSGSLACLVIVSWIAGYIGYAGNPVEVWRESLAYDLERGGQMLNVHLGANDGGTYLLWTVWHVPPHEAAPLRYAGRPEWHLGAAWSSPYERGFLSSLESATGQREPLEPDRRHLGFRLSRYYDFDFTISGFVAVVPVWFLLLLTGAAPAIWLLRRLP
jgi:hypothetical protein